MQKKMRTLAVNTEETVTYPLKPKKAALKLHALRETDLHQKHICENHTKERWRSFKAVILIPKIIMVLVIRDITITAKFQDCKYFLL